MPSKLCIRCETNPRKISSSGKQLTMCDDCQRKDWRKRKQPTDKVVGAGRVNMSTSNTHRKCKSCKTKKPLSQFEAWGNKGHKTTCKQCEDDSQQQSRIAPKPAPEFEQRGKHVLLVNGDQLILAQVVSQADEVNNKALLIDIYRQQGYQIQAVYEIDLN